jgi:hypothetical protein
MYFIVFDPYHIVTCKRGIFFNQLNLTLSVVSHMEIVRHRGMITNEHIRIGINSYEKVKTHKYLRSLETNQNTIHEEVKFRLKAGNSCCSSVQTLLSSRILSKNLKIKIKQNYCQLCYKDVKHGLLH